MTTETTKKRKDRAEGASAVERSTKKPKKDKEKKARKEKKVTAKVTGPQEFTLVHASMVISLPPVFAANPIKGVEEMLDSLIMRYIPALRGVVLTHSNIHFLRPTATLQADSPFAVCHVGFDAMVWNPQIGMRLAGKITLCSPDHVALLVHSTFNVSIPRHHIPTESWEYEHGPAENDPEFGAGTQGLSSPVRKIDQTNTLDSVPETPGVPQTQDMQWEPIGDEDLDLPRGKWVHHLSGDELGGPDGILDFTVVGLTIANQMLSLVGSIQREPFDPVHVAKPPPLAKQREEETEDEVEEEEARILAEESDDEIEDGDLAALGLKTDRILAIPVVRRATATTTSAPKRELPVEEEDEYEPVPLPKPKSPKNKDKDRDRDKDKAKREEKKRKRRESKSGEAEDVVKPPKKNKKDP